jgi:hypothetical protein
MPGFLRGFNFISILKWGTGAVMVTSLRNVVFTCKDDQLLADGTCPITTGQQMLQLYNLDVSVVTYSLGMVACLVIYRAIAFGLLKLKLTSWQLNKG